MRASEGRRAAGGRAREGSWVAGGRVRGRVRRAERQEGTPLRGRAASRQAGW